MKEEQIYIHSVNKNWILFEFITFEYVRNNYILHIIQFKRLWKTNLSVHVKLAKLASIPPRWAKLTPTQPKMVTNGGVDVAEVTQRNHDSFSSGGVQNKVSERF